MTGPGGGPGPRGDARGHARDGEREPHRPRIPLICPRCGHEQRVVPGGPERAVRVVHVATGREACEPGDLARAPDDAD